MGLVGRAKARCRHEARATPVYLSNNIGKKRSVEKKPLGFVSTLFGGDGGSRTRVQRQSLAK